ncbi:MAG: hypothetical protein GYA24_22715 [Candidatus Lokiarchaeota archaeon]|nr:hypothetical protein [Candidatus Lokiarchaeota archaeon]
MNESYLLFKVLTGAIASCFLAAGSFIILKQYAKKKYMASLYMGISWFGFMLEALLDTLSRLATLINGPASFLLRLSYLSLAPGFLGVLALVDSISRDGIESRRFSIIIFLLGINTLVLLVPVDDPALNLSYNMVISIGLFISSYSLVSHVRIYLNVPDSLRRVAMINVIGALNVSVMYVVVNILESIFPNVMPPVSRLFEAVGAFLQTMMFSHNEQLFYVLPFKTQRLIVYDTIKGISLFTHEWSKEGAQLIDEDLFSGILQGMSMIVNESIQKGHVREIKMERGVLLINYDNMHPLAFVIIASKSSIALNQGLASFRVKFVQRFTDALSREERDIPVEPAELLVKECFPFIPQFV